jgi:hypothetical protein
MKTDRNNLQISNFRYLKDIISKFEKEGDYWRQNGGITDSQKHNFKNLITSFEGEVNHNKEQRNTEISESKMRKD